MKTPPEVLTPLHRHAKAPMHCLDAGSLAGLRHRTVIDAASGAAELALWQEEHLPGFRVPLHRHDCEEIITVLKGSIEAEIGEWRGCVAPGESILIPAGADHGFRVIGDAPVCLFAIFASPTPRILRLDGSISAPPWEGGTSDHLECAAQGDASPDQHA